MQPECQIWTFTKSDKSKTQMEREKWGWERGEEGGLGLSLKSMAGTCSLNSTQIGFFVVHCRL